MCKGRWGASVIPVNDAEMTEARIAGPANPFQKKIQEATESLQRWLLVYLVAASDASSMWFPLSLLVSLIRLCRSRIPTDPVTQRYPSPR
jgi:hypothetical protein